MSVDDFLDIARPHEAYLHGDATRWPPRRSTSPMPTQLLVGPKAPSGKKTTVLPWSAIWSAAYLGLVSI